VKIKISHNAKSPRKGLYYTFPVEIESTFQTFISPPTTAHISFYLKDGTLVDLGSSNKLKIWNPLERMATYVNYNQIRIIKPNQKPYALSIDTLIKFLDENPDGVEYEL